MARVIAVCRQALYKEAAPQLRTPRPGRAPRPRPSPTGSITPVAASGKAAKVGSGF